MSASRSAGDLCSRDVATAVRSTAVGDAARLLRERHVGCLVIVDETADGRIPVGMLTDRDIVTAVVARAVDPALLRAGDVMTEDLTTLGEDASVHEAVALMHHRRVRRMPVVSAAGFLVGLLAADDVIRMLAADLVALADAAGSQRQLERMLRP